MWWGAVESIKMLAVGILSRPSSTDAVGNGPFPYQHTKFRAIKHDEAV